MTEHFPFADPGPAVRDYLTRELEGPDGTGFVARLSARLRGLPARDTEWDILAAWARPSVLFAAMAAGFLLGLTVWQNWRDRSPVAPAVSVAMLEEPPLAGATLVYTMLRDR